MYEHLRRNITLVGPHDNGGHKLLVPETEISDQLAVSLDIGPLHIFEKTTSATNHLKQATTIVKEEVIQKYQLHDRYRGAGISE